MRIVYPVTQRTDERVIVIVMTDERLVAGHTR